MKTCSHRSIPLSLPVLLLLGGCQEEPDISSVSAILDAASPIAWAGTLAWAAASGEPGECVSSEIPETFRLTASQDLCPLLLGTAPSGEVLVTVSEASAETLVFAAVFADLSLGSGHAPTVMELGVATVTLRDGSLVVAWADADVGARAESAEVEEGSWVVVVDTAGTPSDPRDDSAVIHGARQWIVASGGEEASGAVVQTALSLASTAPGCRENPVSGGAVIQAVEGDPERAGIDVGAVVFHDRCDGMASFTGGGFSGFSAGQEVSLSAE